MALACQPGRRVIAVASGALGGQFQAIGNSDAPAVNSTTGLYFSLNDMDAQVANVLLVGGDATLTADRSQDMAIYGSDRATADADLTQALATEAGNAAAQRELRSVLDGVGQYEALAADALLTDQQARIPSAGALGRPPLRLLPAGETVDLMRTVILPSVSSLTSVSASRLDASYTSGTSTARTTAVVVIAVGVVLVAILVALQLYLSARFLASPLVPTWRSPPSVHAGRGRPRDHGDDSALGRGGSPEGGQAGRLRLPSSTPLTQAAGGELRRQRMDESRYSWSTPPARRSTSRRSSPTSQRCSSPIVGNDAASSPATTRRSRPDIRRLRRRQRRRAVRRLPGRGVPQHHVSGRAGGGGPRAAGLSGLRTRRQEAARDGEDEPGGRRRLRHRDRVRPVRRGVQRLRRGLVW